MLTGPAQEQAEEELAATDKRRAAYIRRFYGQDWTSRALYHLMMDSCMGEAAMIGAVLAAQPGTPPGQESAL